MKRVVTLSLLLTRLSFRLLVRASVRVWPAIALVESKRSEALRVAGHPTLVRSVVESATYSV